MGWGVYILLFIYTIACVFLIGVILLQSGDKGGGLSSLGASSQGLSDALGATGVEKTFNKLTTIAASLFIILAVVLSFIISGTVRDSDQILDSGVMQSAPISPGAASVAPSVAPVELPADTAAPAAIETNVAPTEGAAVDTSGESPEASAAEDAPAEAAPAQE